MTGTDLRRRLMTEVASESLIFPDDDGYDAARFSYNLVHDRRPLVIVRSLDVETLRSVIRIRHEFELKLAVRGGGHHIGGFSTSEGGILIDFSTFRQVQFDAHANTVTVQPGARLGDVDAELARVGRCLPSGTVSDTGIAGLTLGGGIGWLVGSAGLTCDYLQSAKVLLDDGRFLEVDDDTHPELMAAYRGGGMGGFGLILELRFRTIQLPILTAGSIRFVNNKAVAALNAIGRSHVDEPYSALSIAPVLRRNSGGIEMSVDLCLAGEGHGELERLRKAIGGDWADVVEVPYTEWQSRFDADFLPPKRGYWKSTHFADAARDFAALREVLDRAPSAECTAMVEFYNRDTLRAKAQGSLYPLRDSLTGILLTARWADPRRDEDFAGWVRESAARIAQNGVVGGYSNYSSADEELVVAGYRSESLSVIRNLGEKFDPHRTFAQGHRHRVEQGETA
ncbi:FAD-binding oxidoreductase [Rathayibacter toxicus]|uniref:FAD-binding oxidoreductase n=1 Tax=Rathayibacter toxicus TaxID=145458 RepID=UPI0015E32ADB|nr:FAD-dependent oxidoreductase [Rathayibacter toxicus]QOD11315.1 FAD-dependent oxidoreductase [Rathayibacter toxicus]